VRLSRARTVRRVGRFFLYIAILFVVLFIISPFMWVVITSFQQTEYLMSVPPRVSFSEFNLEFYEQLFGDENFRKALKNSIIVVSLATVFSMIICSFGGYAVGTFPMRGKSFLLFGILVVQLAPALAFLIPLFMMLRFLNFVDTYRGLVLTFLVFQVPIGIWILRGFFNSIPHDLFDAARIDGCSRFGTFFRVALPLARPGIVAVGIFNFIQGWNDLLIPLVVSIYKTTMLTTYASAFGGLHNIDYGGATSVAVLSALPTIVVAVIFRKQLVVGLTAGAVKG